MAHAPPIRPPNYKAALLLALALLGPACAWAQATPEDESPITVGPRLQPKLAPLPEELFNISKNAEPLIAPTTNPEEKEDEEPVAQSAPVLEPSPQPIKAAAPLDPANAESLV